MTRIIMIIADCFSGALMIIMMIMMMIMMMMMIMTMTMAVLYMYLGRCRIRYAYDSSVMLHNRRPEKLPSKWSISQEQTFTIREVSTLMEHVIKPS